MRDGAFYFCVGGFAIRPEPSRPVISPGATWVKSQDGQWRLVAAQVMAIPNERQPIAVGPKKPDEYASQYQLAPDVLYSIMREGNKLFDRRAGRAGEEPLPLCADTFYRTRERGETHEKA
jgi:hypothetical protein